MDTLFWMTFGFLFFWRTDGLKGSVHASKSPTEHN